MKKIGLILLSVFAISACLKDDILKDDLNHSNFLESEYYLSNDFHNSFSFQVLKSELTPYVNGSGDTSCSAELTLKLDETFVKKLKENWDGEVTLLFEGTGLLAPKISFELGKNYSQSFIHKIRSVDCDAPTATLSCEIQLLDPNTTRYTAGTTKNVSIPLHP